MNNNNELVEILSPERLSTYLKKCEDDENRALELYSWNTRASAGFYPLLQGLEIALRNSIHTQLTCDYRENWYSSEIKDTYSKGEIDKVIKKLRRHQQNKNITPSDIIANLSLGFWVSLFSSDYEALWRKSLYKIFESDSAFGKRNPVSKKLQKLRNLRNRVAHHEPIFSLDLQDHLKSILELTKTISPAMAGWMKQYDMDTILQEKPE